MKQYNSNMKQKKIYESYVTDTGSTLVSNYQLCRSPAQTVQQTLDERLHLEGNCGSGEERVGLRHLNP